MFLVMLVSNDKKPVIFPFSYYMVLDMISCILAKYSVKTSISVHCIHQNTYSKHTCNRSKSVYNFNATKCFIPMWLALNNLDQRFFLFDENSPFKMRVYWIIFNVMTYWHIIFVYIIYWNIKIQCTSNIYCKWANKDQYTLYL